jgi:hypothetical protein
MKALLSKPLCFDMSQEFFIYPNMLGIFNTASLAGTDRAMAVPGGPFYI